tara:strand:- start:2704 stop:3330 length:627 start_codon:yes stop_codon:yes gene_type:complete
MLNKFIIVGLVLLFSGKLFAGTEETKNLYLACECEKHNTIYPNKANYVTECKNIKHVSSSNFNINLLYVLDSNGNKDLFRALHSELLVPGTTLPIPGEVYPFSSRDKPVGGTLDTEVTFDFINQLYFPMALSEEDDPFYSYQLLRFAINKYNLNYKINYYFGGEYEELTEYSLLEKNSDHYLKKQYADMENNLQYESEGSCSIIEKQL